MYKREYVQEKQARKECEKPLLAAKGFKNFFVQLYFSRIFIYLSPCIYSIKIIKNKKSKGDMTGKFTFEK